MNALGLVEVIGYVAAVEAADICVKSANVNIVEISKVGAGIVTLTVTGDVGAVKSAVESASYAISKIGTLRSTHVIPRIQKDVADILFTKEDKNKDDEINLDLDKKEINIEPIDILKEKSEEVSIEEEKEIEVEIKDLQSKNIEGLQKEENKELKTISIENKDELKSTNLDNVDLSKKSVKDLKALAKKFDSSITYKALNLLKKEELINLVKELSGEDR